MGNGEIHVGTSGWTYGDWNGVFYPAGVTGAERLRFYARHFDTVEVNATFYRLPGASMIEGWNRRLPPQFHMVAKGPRRVTHHHRLEDCAAPLQRFLERVSALAPLKVLLWQLPPSLHRDVERLERFLAQLPALPRHAVEFRHASWWGDGAVAEALRRHNAAWVAVSHPRLPGTVVPTADFLYVRFHGLGRRLYDYDYAEAELQDWVERLAGPRQGRTLYAFFNNDFHAHAVRNAGSFRAMLERG